jgi:hypothetical protein
MTSIRRLAILSTALLGAALCAGALAQQPAAPAAATTAAPTVTIPKPNCGDKPEPVSRLASDRQKASFTKEANPYPGCLKKYALEMDANSREYNKAAMATIDLHNATAKEYQEAMQ